jgi:hypothetical protein
MTLARRPLTVTIATPAATPATTRRREPAIRAWRRRWRLGLVERMCPEWRELDGPLVGERHPD